MLRYFGMNFLLDLYHYYNERLSQALMSGFNKEGHKYHWLYEELAYRTDCVMQTHLALEALPAFLIHATPEEAFGYMHGMTSRWFRDETASKAPKGEDGQCYFYSDECQYWKDINDALDAFDEDFDYTAKPIFHIMIVEYVVRCLRLHFFMREKLLKSIDRSKFDGLMKMEARASQSA